MEIMEIDEQKELNTEFDFLENNLFIGEGNLGVYSKQRCYLNINLLPNYFKFLRDSLSSIEMSSLNDYTLQNRLIELSTIKLQLNNLHQLSEYILMEIRGDSKYWIENSEVYHRIRKGEDQIIHLNRNEMERVINYQNYIQRMQKVSQHFNIQQSKQNITDHPDNTNDDHPDNTNDDHDDDSNHDVNGQMVDMDDLVEENKRVTRGQLNRLNEMIYDLPQKTNKAQTRYNRLIHHQQQMLFLNINQSKKHCILELQLIHYLYNYAKQQLAIDNDQLLIKKKQLEIQNCIFYFGFDD